MLASEGAPAPRRHPGLRVAAGLALGVAAAIAVALYLGISGRALLSAARGARHGPLYVAAAGAIALLALQSLRWWLVMRAAVGIRYAHAFQAMAVGFLFNVLLPARGGDLLRVQYLGKRTGISRAKLLGTEIVDFGSDKLGWLIAFPLICSFGDPPRWLFRTAWLMGGVALVAVGVLALMGSRLGRGRPGGGDYGPRWLANLRAGFAVNHWKRLLTIQLMVAPLPWVWETAVVAWAGRSFGLSLTMVQAFSVLTAFNVATAVPSPGNVGSFEAGGTLALTTLGVPRDIALAFVFLYHLTQVVPTAALGALVLVARGEKIFGKGGFLRAGGASTPAPGNGDASGAACIDPVSGRA